ncbi:MAG TPA: transcription termination/antitermination protein NusA [Clostridiales bacterium]|nr:transcription termination/antitermination protein NusA [Clostridiales bacterium]
MAARKTKKKKVEENPIRELCTVAREIAKVESIDEADVLDAIERAVVTSLKQDYHIGKKVDVTTVLNCKIDPEAETMDIILRKKVVDEFFDHKKHILLNRAVFYAPNAQVGDMVLVPEDPSNYVDNNPGDPENPYDPAVLYSFEPLDPEDAFYPYCEKKVVEEAYTPDLTMLPDEARQVKPDAQIGDVIEMYLDSSDYSFYKVAHKCRQIMAQNIKELRVAANMKKFDNQAGTIKTGIVTEISQQNTVVLSIEGVSAYLTTHNQIPGDIYKIGDHVKVYNGNPTVSGTGEIRLEITRSHKDFVKALFENEVPEIAEKIVEIKAISRDAGSRTKMAVHSDKVDPIGACIGENSSRINSVIKTIGGIEKIDIVKYSDDKAEFVKSALSPAHPLVVFADPIEEGKYIAVMEHDKVSLAIGKHGQNAKLAAQLTDTKIEVWDLADHPGVLEDIPVSSKEGKD